MSCPQDLTFDIVEIVHWVKHTYTINKIGVNIYHAQNDAKFCNNIHFSLYMIKETKTAKRNGTRMQILIVASPGPCARTFLEFLKKKIFFLIFLRILFVFVNMGAKISEHYSSYKSQPKVLKLSLNFLANGPHKTAFGIFEILKIEILTNFNEHFEACPEFSTQ